MNTVCELNKCCGCMLCHDLCPKNAIEVIDSMEAHNAVINNDLCVKCDICRNACQRVNPVQLKKPITWHQGWAEDENIRKTSTSGGMAAAIMHAFYRKHGNVCACTFENGEFIYRFVRSEDDIKNFVGSKYVKSDPSGIYKQIRERLTRGEKVLFIGLPCHAAAVKKFLDSGYSENLFTADIICHGTPSAKMAELFLKDCDASLNKIKKIAFRENEKYKISFDGEPVLPENIMDPYILSFLNGLDFTENCYSCKYAALERVSDITLGDAWGSELWNSEKDKGLSLMLCQTEKGEALIRDAEAVVKDIDIFKASKSNRQLNAPHSVPAEREKFFREVRKHNRFSYAVWSCYPKEALKRRIKLLAVKFK